MSETKGKGSWFGAREEKGGEGRDYGWWTRRRRKGVRVVFGPRIGRMAVYRMDGGHEEMEGSV